MPLRLGGQGLPSHSSMGPRHGRCDSLQADCGASSTDHRTSDSSSAGVEACWAATGALKAAAPMPPAKRAPATPASWLSIRSRASRLRRSSLLRLCCVWQLLGASLHTCSHCCSWLLAAAPEAAGKWRDASAETARQRCCRPARSD